MERIVSRQNARVRAWRKLHTRKGRERAGLFLLEGTHVVAEALAAGAPVTHVLWDETRPLPEELAEWAGRAEGPRWVACTPEVIAHLATTETPQAVLAIARIPERDRRLWLAEAANASARGLVLLVDAVQDPGNVGTLIRTADAAGADAVFLGTGSADAYNPKTVRATMGSLFHVPVFAAPLEEVVAALRKAGWTVWAAALSGARYDDPALYTRPTAFVVGNEASGVSPDLAARTDGTVTIPMPGRAESLNVAVAAGVLLFEAVRQRRREHGSAEWRKAGG
ncbi:TrmH family RNA methyltransferase [Calditerricola satsumensis]|nr:RNA methyltransferase [Calditerricola satsumensis]